MSKLPPACRAVPRRAVLDFQNAKELPPACRAVPNSQNPNRLPLVCRAVPMFQNAKSCRPHAMSCCASFLEFEKLPPAYMSAFPGKIVESSEAQDVVVILGRSRLQVSDQFVGLRRNPYELRAQSLEVTNEIPGLSV